MVALPETKNPTVAFPLAGAVQLKVQDAVPETGAFDVVCRISIAPFKAVPAMAVKAPVVAVKLKPSLKPKGVVPTSTVLVTEMVIGYTVPFVYPPTGKPVIVTKVLLESEP